MVEPVQGERGLWYVGTVGFATKEQAQAYIDRGMSHYSAPEIKTQVRFLDSLWAPVLLVCGVVVLAWLALNKFAGLAPDKGKMNALFLCQKTIGSLAAYGDGTNLPGYTTVRMAGDVWQFLWPHGAFHFKNGFGVDVPQSARCEVDPMTGKIVYLFVSGKTIIK